MLLDIVCEHSFRKIFDLCNNFAQIRKQHHLEKIPGKESENLYEHTILEIAKVPELQNVTYMIWLSYYSRWQTLILTFACFVDFLLVSFQHLILGMICALNGKNDLRFLERLVCVKLLMIFVSVF